MKRWALGVFAAIVLAVSAFSTSASAVTDFYFSSFDADYYLSRDSDGFSTLRVKETLVAEFSNYGNDNHGIERALPMFYKFNDGTPSHSLDLSVDGVNDQYTTRTENGFLMMRIGNPNMTVHGSEEYKINWSARNVTRNFDSGDEFYWDVNGTGWKQYFKEVTARVHISSDLVSELDGRVKCGIGLDDRECEISEEENYDGSKTFTFSSYQPDDYFYGNGMVRSGETMTFDIGFNAGTFAEPPFDIGAQFGMSTGAFWASVIISVVFTIAAIIWLIIVINKFRPIKTGRAIIPQYLPPKDLSVTEAAVWFSNLPLFFPATLINLAVRHYIEIIEDGKVLGGKKFSIKLVKIPDDQLSLDERVILNAVFMGNLEVGAIVKTKDLQRNTTFQEVLRDMPNGIKKRFRKEYAFYKTKRNLDVLPILFIVGGFILAFLVGSMLESGLLLLLSLPSLIITIIASILFKPISQRGMEAEEYLEGLRMYMKLAEAERLKVLQSVQGAERIATDQGEIIKLYEKLLPYAVIFKITKDWAKVLQVYYDVDPSFAPVWFVGSSGVSSISSFDAAGFASSINSFSNSGSGFSSGSGGGGGFSGGGGGGGGGGGW